MAKRIFTVSEAPDLDISPHLLRSGRFAVPTSGVRIDDADPSLIDHCRAIARVVHPNAVFARTTALRLLGVDLPWQLADDQAIHVVTPRRGERAQRHAITAHFCGQKQLDVVDRFGLRITSAPQTWLQVAHGLDRDSLVGLGDAMTRRKGPATTVPALGHLMRETFKMRGLALCREAVDLVRPGTDSPMETRLRLIIVDAGLPEPAVNVPARDAAGQFLALPDLSYPELKIAIEYDGDHHRTDAETWRRDVERRQRLEDAGWLIITATADDVIRHPARLIARIRAALRNR
ncbi:endonuclease domain-containing protein [Promicromonospora sp. NPDC059942]|uniref:endonuclease domain-containing protein n=1 Tax=Promicromonospora sp. NPDC059942 TaxID=3347009 RepID=UPI003652B56F